MLNTPKLVKINFNFEDMKENENYKIISQDIHDEVGNSYLTLSSGLRVKNQEHLIVHPDLPNYELEAIYRYEKEQTAEINKTYAKMCGFGVIEVLTGRHKESQFMYPLLDLDDEEIMMHLFAYGVLTHQYADKLTVKKIISDRPFRINFCNSLDLGTVDFYDCSNPYFYVMDELANIDSRSKWLGEELI